MTVTAERKVVAIRCPQCRQGRHAGCTGHGCECECRDTRAAINWEDPPSGGRGKGGWTPPAVVVDELKNNPGRWARVGDFEIKSTAGACALRLKKTAYPPPSLGTDRPAHTDRLVSVHALPRPVTE